MLFLVSVAATLPSRNSQSSTFLPTYACGLVTSTNNVGYQSMCVSNPRKIRGVTGPTTSEVRMLVLRAFLTLLEVKQDLIALLRGNHLSRGGPLAHEAVVCEFHTALKSCQL